MLRARIVARRLGARGLANWGKGTPVQMPALSPTMTAGKIAKWSKKPGGERASEKSLSGFGRPARPCSSLPVRPHHHPGTARR